MTTSGEPRPAAARSGDRGVTGVRPGDAPSVGAVVAVAVEAGLPRVMASTKGTTAKDK